jgi:glycosyltransferase involved in cell wall biosynthesis
MRRIKITFLLTCFDVSGVETIIAKIIRGLDQQRYQVRVIALQRRSGALVELLQPMGAECIDVGVAHQFDVFALPRLARYIRGTDVLHTATFQGTILGRLLGRLLKVPVILGSEVIMDFESRFRLTLNRWTAGIPDFLLCNADAVRRYVIATLGVPESKAITVYQGVNVDAYPAKQTWRDSPVIGTVGRLHYQKGYRYLIEAAAIVHRTFPDVRWVWIGEGPARGEIESLIHAQGLHAVIELAGYCGDMLANLARFDYYVHPAIAEGMPYAVVEAMAGGLPVVATDVGGTSELIERGVSGLVVPPADAAALAESVLQLLTNTESARVMGAAARERIRQAFPEHTMAEAEDRLIRQALMNKGRVLDVELTPPPRRSGQREP